MRRSEQVASKARRDITQLHRPLKLKLKRCKDEGKQSRAVLARGFFMTCRENCFLLEEQFKNERVCVRCRRSGMRKEVRGAYSRAGESFCSGENSVIKKEDSYMDEGCGSRSKNRTRRMVDALCVSVRPFG